MESNNYNFCYKINKGNLTLDLFPRKGKNTHGFCFGIETEKDANEIIKYCMEHGVLVIKAKNKASHIKIYVFGYHNCKKKRNC